MSAASYFGWLRYGFKETNCWISHTQKSLTYKFILSGLGDTPETSDNCPASIALGLGVEWGCKWEPGNILLQI